MRSLIAFLIETVFNHYDDKYSPVLFYGNTQFILQTFSGYVISGLIAILIPVIIMILFYKVFDFVHGKLWHWIVTSTISLLTVLIVNIVVTRNQLIDFVIDETNNPNVGSFIFEYSFYIMVISIIPLILTILFKYSSKNNKYNPF